MTSRGGNNNFKTISMIFVLVLFNLQLLAPIKRIEKKKKTKENFQKYFILFKGHFIVVVKKDKIIFYSCII